MTFEPLSNTIERFVRFGWLSPPNPHLELLRRKLPTFIGHGLSV